jgi:hypothetical protein
MKKNEKDVSKNAATMMRKLDKKELEVAGGGLFKLPCYFCGLLQTNI